MRTMRSHLWSSKTPRLAVAVFVVLLFFAGAVSIGRADALVTFQAESGTLGADWAVSNAVSPAFITILTDGAGNNPSNATRVASYTVTFPEPGLYQLYARLRTGPGTFNDDSLFYATGFGAKSPTQNSDWVFVNGLAAGGFSNNTDVVTGGGSLGSGMWKWINLSQFTSQSGFTVSAGSLTQTFQIGARENGLDLDRCAFGTAGVSLTVSNLDTGTVPPTVTLTNAFPGPDGVALHRFSPLNNGLNADGANPAAGLALSGGVLVGTTLNGGAQGAGTAFVMSLDGTNFASIRAFTNAPDAGAPQGELSVAGNRFFGTSASGGVNGTGAVFAGQTNGSTTLLRSFTAVGADYATNVGGASPAAMLALSGGTLFGTTTAGGTAGNGTIISLGTNGAAFTVLRNFSLLNSQTGTNTDGAVPTGGLILSGSTLYGTASGGGAGGSGVVFSIGTNGANFTVLYHFTAMDPLTGTNADGAVPLGGLVLLSNKLHGTAFAGGRAGRGVIFSIQTNGGGFSVLHHFTATDPAGTNSEGASPSAALLASDNVLFGTASAGGTGAAGTVYSLNPANPQFTTLYSFPAVAANGTNAYGAFPVAPLVRAGGSLFGTAFGGGPGVAGTVFSLPLPPPTAVITNVGINLNGTVTLYFLGGPNSTNVIQSTPSLAAAAWQNVSTNVADANGAWQFTDGTGAAARFYRSHAR
jgi:uncharacterized repeat protein (TIGR03803 family)